MSTPADDAGEVAALRAELAQLQRAYEIKCEARDQSWRDASEARAEVDSLRVTLAAVKKVADQWANADGEPLTTHDLTALTTVNRLGNQLRAILATDPVSLADVRSDAWDEADYMCPNCVTPWKCNGPHVEGVSDHV